ncbi:MAG: recombination protein RecR, partial [Verrucomicrobiota bacterium]
MKLDYPEAVQQLIGELKRLPGIGAKSAERMAVWILQQDTSASDLSRVLTQVQKEIGASETCGFFSTSEGSPNCDRRSED